MVLILSQNVNASAPGHVYSDLSFCRPKDIIEDVKPTVRYIANVSWYTASDDECGKSDGITASGEQAVAGVTVAADDLPLGTRVRINGHEYIVHDRFGGGYKGRIDIYCGSKEEAFANGRQMLEVEVLE